jgi:hypothetical protein
MAVRIKFDQTKMTKLAEAQIQALEMTAEDILSDIVASQVVPKDVGTLERSKYVDNSHSKEGKAAVGFNTPYARRLYYHPEYNFRTDKNPNAQGRWMDMYLPGGEEEDFAQDTFSALLKQLAGGLIK